KGKILGKIWGRPFLSGLLALMLLLGSLPTAALAQGNTAESTISQDIEAQLSAGSYVEGEVLAVVPSGAAQTAYWFTQTDETSTTLGTASAQSYVTGSQDSLSGFAAADEDLLPLKIQR
ncbi:MAG: hypothetical protein ACRCSI_11030, partial [Eubacterium aggregans]